MEYTEIMDKLELGQKIMVESSSPNDGDIVSVIMTRLDDAISVNDGQPEIVMAKTSNWGGCTTRSISRTIYDLESAHGYAMSRFNEFIRKEGSTQSVNDKLSDGRLLLTVDYVPHMNNISINFGTRTKKVHSLKNGKQLVYSFGRREVAFSDGEIVDGFYDNWDDALDHFMTLCQTYFDNGEDVDLYVKE